MDEEETGRAAGAWRLAVAVALCLALTAVSAAAVADPGLPVALLPGLFTGSTSWGRTLQVLGGLSLLVPVLAAVRAGLRGRNRATGWFAVLALLALGPAVLAIELGASRVRQAERAGAPVVERCVERSGGDTRCPGG